MRIKKAVIPAAGWGTRFLPATKAQAKEMFPIVDKPAIQYIIEEARASGIEDIIIVTGRNKRSIEDHFDRNHELELFLRQKGSEELFRLVEEVSRMVDVHYVRQKEPRGLGHAVLCARKFIGNEPFAVLLGDDIVDGKVPCLKQLMKVAQEVETSVLAVQEVPSAEISRYGVVAPIFLEDGLYMVKDLVEKPAPEEAPSNLAIIGRYILTPEIFPILAQTPPDKRGEIQLTDALRKLLLNQDIYAYCFDGDRYDVGDKLGYLKAVVRFALKEDSLAGDFGRFLLETAEELKMSSFREVVATNEKVG
ncbi:UTP--glucose-1-phosphate uridylyltransferase GalU [Calderihabitans maritimus]|uniref:UTP--glucose-1-phosphate uridylyltransferase n=1 Tax=Calderihabitans maritimus TaxID=1246530 RepID=A0A1Z5HRY7_9FIRM|nr:UTP--glucose-1-phosphate uridylyltransferase GalU [Calderihabitans maritimus]GAW92085.1 UDP-glucose pyrophosphorylase [Calderihabitans maritimus]